MFSLSFILSVLLPPPAPQHLRRPAQAHTPSPVWGCPDG